MAFPQKPCVSLEAPDIRAYAHADPRGFIAQHRDGAILDEVQRAPELASYLQGEVDARPEPGRFILTGSANLSLLQSVSQSLAGRTALLTLLPLSHAEVLRFPQPPADLFETLWRGGYPAIFDRALPPHEWLAAYVGTYVDRDVRQLLNVTDLLAFQTFLRLAAGRASQLLNLSALGADAGVTHNTAKAWVSVLEATYVAVRVPPLHVNIRKRLTRTPKVLFCDPGLLCYLLGISSPEQLRHHPSRGAIFETWALSEILKVRVHRGLAPALSFYRDRQGHGGEIDAIVDRGDAIVALEAKSAQTVADDFFSGFARGGPALTSAASGRPIEKRLVYGGDRRERRHDVEVLPWREMSAAAW